MSERSQQWPQHRDQPHGTCRKVLSRWLGEPSVGGGVARRTSARTFHGSDATEPAVLLRALPPSAETRKSSQALHGISMLGRACLSASIALAFWAAALLSGCLAVRTPESGVPVRVAAEEGIVFGRVRVFELGHELTPWKRELTEILAEDPAISLALFHVESGRKRPDVPISAEGGFEWILPAGTYLLYHTPSFDPPFNEPLAAFQVTPGSDLVDLGELRLAISVDRPLSWRLATYTLLSVEASAGNGETAALFLRLHPGTNPVRQGVFVVDPELGGLFTNWSRKACARILARHGVEINLSEEK